MTQRFRRVAALATALLACSVSIAVADPIDASVGLTINALDGAHKTGGGQEARLDFAPLPLAEVTLRHHADSLHLEGLPPVTVGYGAQPEFGTLTTRLSIANVTYRRSIRGGWFAGLGQTLYNQHTTYGSSTNGAIYERRDGPFPMTYPINGSEEQYSRVTGMRIEAGRMWNVGSTRIEAIAAANPAMHGVQYTYVPTPSWFHTSCSGRFSGPRICTGGNPTFADPEHAAQVDLIVRAAHRLSKHGELIYGVRYLHYSARYENDPGQLADRNLGIAPVLGYRVRF